ncbi:PatB family C-S lyase [candidate division WOR-3 bacterium]|nr:PatB family C-S lyase [candidate division WOR-3 bacterium]
MTDFDKPLCRRNSGSYKWDFAEKTFGAPGLLPFWVADMDLPCPEELVEALIQRAKHPVYGYTLRTKDHFNSLCRWFKKMHSWKIEPQWCVHSPSLITALSVCVEEFSKEGEGIIIQPPVYRPFYEVVELNKRKLLKNDLVRGEDGVYRPDLENLEKLCRDGAKIFILCSPHNPVGRVWSEEELLGMSKICFENGVLILSDEIHCDLVFNGFKHIPLASISKEHSMNSVNLVSPAKTFNVAGLQESAVIAENTALRDRISRRIYSLGLHVSNVFGSLVFEKVYSSSDHWYKEMMSYLSENRRVVTDFFNGEFTGTFVMPPEATYLAWVDFSQTGFSAERLDDLLIKKAKVALDPGGKFGDNCDKFKRINFACPRKKLRKALERIEKAISN